MKKDNRAIFTAAAKAAQAVDFLRNMFADNCKEDMWNNSNQNIHISLLMN